MPDAKAPIEVFCSYAPEDQVWFEKLETHLSLLKRQHLISTWHKRLVFPGTNWEQDIDTHLNNASIILLLISADFLASDYCYGREVQQAMRRQAAEEVQVLPILVRSVDWATAPFAYLQVLPKDSLPIAKWSDEDEAWTNVVTAIRHVIEDLPLHVDKTSPSHTVPPPDIWNVPYPRNPFFTGHDDMLSRLHTYLQAGHSDIPSHTPQAAISGLGGLGKTQLALEYAYRYKQDYQAIFWIRADTHETIVSDHVTLAQKLNLTEKEEKDQTIIVQAVLRWLSTHSGWLLILDNADDLAVLEGMLPLEHRGHLLLTTRAQALGTLARPLEMTIMPQDIGATLLLRRTRLIATGASLDTALPADITIARAISAVLGGLPLALDQAGAYIEESRCSLTRYQSLYRLQPSPLLKRRGGSQPDYPSSVATTWSLSFEKVEQQNPMAAELLRCCAFVHPDAIPEELFMAGVAHLGPGLQQMRRDPLAFDEAIRVLLAYSLIHRDPTTATLSIHRLVQAILRDVIPAKTRKLWRERIIRALNAVFPEVVFEEWTICERFLPHIQVSTAWIEHESTLTLAGAHVLHKAGVYLRERGQFLESETLLVRAHTGFIQNLGDEHPDTATSLNNLALLYREQGKYEQAEHLYQRALKICEQYWGTEHPNIAISLNNLANLCWQQSKYEQAELLHQRALTIREQHLGTEHPDTATSLNDLANLYWWQGKYKQAESLYVRALTIREQYLGSKHPDTAKSLHNLALLYREQDKYGQAESLFQRALVICEECLGAKHPLTASTLNNLAILYQRQKKYEQAESLYLRAVTIREQLLGTGHHDTARSLNTLADLYREQGKYEQAESLFQRALTIWEQCLGTEHPDSAEALHGLAELYREKGRYEQAEVFYQRALAIRKERLGPTHPETQNTQKGYAALLQVTGRDIDTIVLDTNHEPSAERDH